MFNDLFQDDDDQQSGGKYQYEMPSIGAGAQIPRPPDLRSQCGFVGLENQGATCYLNSLIQVMFMTPELRTGLFEVDPEALGANFIAEFEEQKSKEGSIEPDENLLESLKTMGFNEYAAQKALIETKNAGFEQAVEYCMEHQDDPSMQQPTAVDDGAKRKKKKPRYIPLELQRLFTQLQELNQRAISTEDLTTRGFQWQGMDGRVQHDAHELNRLLIDALERSLKGTAGEALCQNLYQGYLVYQTKCLECRFTSEREEKFYDLNVQVTGCANLAQALRQYVTAEVMDGDSAYACETCAHRTKALRSTVIRSMPPVLTFSCNRFKCDRTTKWAREKITDRSDFPLLLNMRHFSEGSRCSGTEALDFDQEMAMLEELKSTMVWVDDVHTQAQQIAKEIVLTRGTEATLADLTPEELTGISNAMRSLDNFVGGNASSSAGMEPGPGPSDAIYQLFAVIMHRGSAHSGHYFAYIRDTMDEGAWVLPSAALEDTTVGKGAKGAKGSKGDKDNKAGGKAQLTQAIGASAAQPNDCDEYLLTSDGLLLVDDASPLAKLIGIFQSQDPTIAVKGMTLGNIGKAIKTNLGSPWSKLFQETHGNLQGYLEKHAFFFEFVAKNVRLRDVTSTLVSTSEFQSALVCKKSEAEAQNQTKGQNQAVGGSDTQLEVSAASGSASASAIGEENEDEELARALQASLNMDNDDESAGAGDEWQTATNKKTKKKPAPSPKAGVGIASGNSSGGEASTGTAMTEEEALADQLIKQAERRLAHDIANKFHGRFFEFNDSTVSALTVQGLSRAFEGKDSAYILVYHKIEPSSIPSEKSSEVPQPKEAKPKRKAPKDTKAGSQHQSAPSVSNTMGVLTLIKSPSPRRHDRPKPPPFWLSKVNHMNEVLAVARSRFEIESHMSKVRVYFPNHVEVENYLLRLPSPPKDTTEEKKVDVGPIPESCRHFIDVDMDVRETVSMLRSRVLALCRGHERALGLTVPEDAVCLSELSPCGPGFHPKAAMEATAVLGDTLTKGLNMLVWDGSAVQGTIIQAGPEGTPVQLSVCLLGSEDNVCPAPAAVVAADTTPSPSPKQNEGKGIEGKGIEKQKTTPKNKKKGQSTASPGAGAPTMETLPPPSPSAASPAPTVVPPAAPTPSECPSQVMCIDDFWVPRSTAVSELCVMAAERLGLDPQTACVHLIDAKGTKAATGTKWVRGKSSTASLSKGLRAVPLWIGKSQPAILSSSLPSKASTTKGKGDDKPINTALTVSDMISEQIGDFFGSELLVEAIDGSTQRSASSSSSGAHGLGPRVYLAEKEVARRNISMDISVEVDFSPTSLLESDSAGAKDAKVAANAEEDSEVHSIMKFTITFDTSAADLKLRVLAKLGLAVERFGPITRLRRGSSRGEDIIEDETTLLVDAGVHDSDTISIEQGKQPGPKSTVVRVAHVRGNDRGYKFNPKQPGARGLVVEMEVAHADSVTSLRDAAGVQLLGLPPGWTSGVSMERLVELEDGGVVIPPSASSNNPSVVPSHRLRFTNWQEECGELVAEISDKEVKGSKAATSTSTSDTQHLQMITVEEAKLQSGCLLLLEEGDLPVKGMLTLPIYVWVTSPTAPLADVTSSSVQADDGSGSGSGEVSSEDQAAGPGEDTSVLEAAEALRRRCLVPLGAPLAAHEDSTLEELQTIVFALLVENAARFADLLPEWQTPGTADDFLLRELRADLLPGRRLWTCNAPVASQVNLSSIGKPSAKPTATAAGASATLKKLQLHNEKALVVEILRQPQAKVRPPAGALTVWVQRLLNPDAKGEGQSIMSPLWPPLQVMVDGGAHPTLGHLTRAICGTLTMSTDRAVLFKCNPSASSWTELKPGSKSAGGRGGKNNKKIENITQAPYSIKEGDLLCAFEGDSGSAASYQVDRPEDLCLRSMRAKIKREKSNRKHDENSGSQNDVDKKKKKGYAEIALCIGGNLDFSDSDADES